MQAEAAEQEETGGPRSCSWRHRGAKRPGAGVAVAALADRLNRKAKATSTGEAFWRVYEAGPNLRQPVRFKCNKAMRTSVPPCMDVALWSVINISAVRPFSRGRKELWVCVHVRMPDEILVDDFGLEHIPDDRVASEGLYFFFRSWRLLQARQHRWQVWPRSVAVYTSASPCPSVF